MRVMAFGPPVAAADTRYSKKWRPTERNADSFGGEYETENIKSVARFVENLPFLPLALHKKSLFFLPIF